MNKKGDKLLVDEELGGQSVGSRWKRREMRKWMRDLGRRRENMTMTKVRRRLEVKKGWMRWKLVRQGGWAELWMGRLEVHMHFGSMNPLYRRIFPSIESGTESRTRRLPPRYSIKCRHNCHCPKYRPCTSCPIQVSLHPSQTLTVKES